jgi:hypothetical protein
MIRHVAYRLRQLDRQPIPLVCYEASYTKLASMLIVWSLVDQEKFMEAERSYSYCFSPTSRCYAVRGSRRRRDGVLTGPSS